jgi:hypothetical protein
VAMIAYFYLIMMVQGDDDCVVLSDYDGAG